ncbi:unnamed protein product [Vicia faba]|uniref:Secreted protein n=1 Tax=Vicia faba TaxID=3906 RepID=A0AAV0YY69_VICFA|nr:unnamed protein product [Vicia faba]
MTYLVQQAISPLFFQLFLCRASSWVTLVSLEPPRGRPGEATARVLHLLDASGSHFLLELRNEDAIVLLTISFSYVKPPRCRPGEAAARVLHFCGMWVTHLLARDSQ